MKLYRLEHKDTHKGPFRHSWRQNCELCLLQDECKGNNCELAWYDKTYFPSDGFLAPQDETRINRKPFHFEKVACISLGQLHYWFSEQCILELKAFGFRVIEFDVPEARCVVGKYQVLFDEGCIENIKEVA